jgi:hypothetical protein
MLSAATCTAHVAAVLKAIAILHRHGSHSETSRACATVGHQLEMPHFCTCSCIALVHTWLLLLVRPAVDAARLCFRLALRFHETLSVTVR